MTVVPVHHMLVNSSMRLTNALPPPSPPPSSKDTPISCSCASNFSRCSAQEQDSVQTRTGCAAWVTEGTERNSDSCDGRCSCWPTDSDGQTPATAAIMLTQQNTNLLFVSQQLTTELSHSKLKYGLFNRAVSSTTYRLDIVSIYARNVPC